MVKRVGPSCVHGGATPVRLMLSLRPSGHCVEHPVCPQILVLPLRTEAALSPSGFKFSVTDEAIALTLTNLDFVAWRVQLDGASNDPNTVRGSLFPLVCTIGRGTAADTLVEVHGPGDLEAWRVGY